MLSSSPIIVSSGFTLDSFCKEKNEEFSRSIGTNISSERHPVHKADLPREVPLLQIVERIIEDATLEELVKHVKDSDGICSNALGLAAAWANNKELLKYGINIFGIDQRSRLYKTKGSHHLIPRIFFGTQKVLFNTETIFNPFKSRITGILYFKLP